MKAKFSVVSAHAPKHNNKQPHLLICIWRYC